MRLRRTTLALAAGVAVTFATLSITDAKDRSGSGLGHIGVPRPSGNSLGGNSLGGKPFAGKGVDIGQAKPSPGMNNPDSSRRDRRGQPQPQADVGRGPKPRVILGCYRPQPHRGCRKFDPYQEFPNRRAQVRDHRKP